MRQVLSLSRANSWVLCPEFICDPSLSFGDVVPALIQPALHPLTLGQGWGEGFGPGGHIPQDSEQLVPLGSELPAGSQM